jgi:protein-S-isoprenylcysteine O-methyltransferase Ste14
VATSSPWLRVDLGRLIMVPSAGLMLAFDLAALTHHTHHTSDGVSVLRWLELVPACAFYVLLIWSYLRRGPAVATSGSFSAHACAVLATLTPFALPLLQGTPPGPEWQLVADTLVLAGVTWSVWSMHSLGTNLSVIAQAREVASRGPYRWVRHPLYAGEIVSSLGLAIAAWSPAAIGLWLALCAMQGYRALREEQVLLQALPAYRTYRARTAALLPGIF